MFLLRLLDFGGLGLHLGLGRGCSGLLGSRMLLTGVTGLFDKLGLSGLLRLLGDLLLGFGFSRLAGTATLALGRGGGIFGLLGSNRLSGLGLLLDLGLVDGLDGFLAAEKQTSRRGQNLGHLGYRGHLKRRELHVEVADFLRLGGGRLDGALVLLLRVLALLVHLRILQRGFRQQFRLEMLALAGLLAGRGCRGLRLVGIGSLMVENFIDEFLCVKTLGFGNAHFLGNSNKLDVSLGREF